MDDVTNGCVFGVVIADSLFDDIINGTVTDDVIIVIGLDDQLLYDVIAKSILCDVSTSAFVEDVPAGLVSNGDKDITNECDLIRESIRDGVTCVILEDVAATVIQLLSEQSTALYEVLKPL